MNHNNLNVSTQARAAAQAGVTLIELMVGLVVGLLAVLVISQVMLTSEGQKRTATGGADAQISGALALYTLQRDLEQAGYGIANNPSIFGCPLSARFNGAVVAGFAPRLEPVVITPQASRPAGSVGDSIRILSSSADTFAMPIRVLPPEYLPGNQVFNVQSIVGFRQGDLALAAKPGDITQPCSVFQVTGVPAANALPRANNATWNAAGTPSTGYTGGDLVINLGQLLDNVYEINGGVLQLSSFNAAAPAVRTTRDLQTDIVQMRAFYGRDTSVPPAGVTTDGTVDIFDTTTPTVGADWDRVLSVRIIAVARSSAFEREIVTTANPRWSVGELPATTGAVSCSAGGPAACIELDVGAGVAGDVPAKHYRYKVFETIVPLRNTLWRST
jgi:type IV pilus assembly protein PilW